MQELLIIIRVSMEDKMATLGEANQLMYELRHAYDEVAVESSPMYYILNDCK